MDNDLASLKSNSKMPTSEKGISLIELLVAMTIGLIVILVVTDAFLGSINIKKSQVDVSRINESARFAFDLISREIRKAGYSNTWAPVPPGTIKSFGSANNAVLGLNNASQIDPSASDLSGTAITTLNSSDIIRVNYYGEDDNSVLDCHGYPVSRGTLVSDTLFIANDTATNEPSLFCYTNNPTPAVTGVHPGSLPLVTGVESLQLLYGEDTDNDGVVNRYVPWGLARTSGNFDPTKILTIKVSMVLRSPNSTGIDTSFQTYKHFGATYTDLASTTANDPGVIFTPTVGPGRIRTMLSTEIGLRNFQ